MTELAILVAAVCLLAIVIDHYRAFDVTALSVRMFVRGDRITDLRGGRYRVVGRHMDRDVLRIRRCGPSVRRSRHPSRP